MERGTYKLRSILPRWTSIVFPALAIWALVSIGSGSSQAVAKDTGQNTGTGTVASQASPSVTCPSGICFTDVTSTNPFSTTINNLYLDGIISGYACGSASEPCDGQNRPYYRPNNDVTRGQMSKFVDNGRRNIADAIGSSLIITPTSAFIGVGVRSNSGGEALRGECLQAGSGCWAVQGYSSVAGNYAGYFSGGEGLYAQSSDASAPGADIRSTGGSAYGANITSSSYRGGYVNATATGYYSLYVDKANDGVTDLYVNSGAEISGNLIVDGSKTGYVVDVMQNVDTTPLEPGDVVVIVGNGPPVVGQIPVVLVKKATSAYDSGVAGVVDQVVYVPDAATKAAYDSQEAAIRAARDKQAQMNTATTDGLGPKPDAPQVTIPAATISDDQGTLHAMPAAVDATQDSYVNVVTLGSYKAVKVDASFGAIHAGDLLTTSPHAGYAMKVTDKSQAFGATIGKALDDLESGTGTIPVLVTLK